MFSVDAIIARSERLMTSARFCAPFATNGIAAPNAPPAPAPNAAPVAASRARSAGVVPSPYPNTPPSAAPRAAPVPKPRKAAGAVRMAVVPTRPPVIAAGSAATAPAAPVTPPAKFRAAV